MRLQKAQDVHCATMVLAAELAKCTVFEPDAAL